MFLITFMELPSHSFVVAAVQEQRPNVGTTRTLLLQNNAAAHKTLVTILYLEGETSSAPPTAQPCDCWLFVVVVFTLKIGLAEKKTKKKTRFWRTQNLAKAVDSLLHFTQFGVPQRLKKYLAKATATMSGQQRRVL